MRAKDKSKPFWTLSRKEALMFYILVMPFIISFIVLWVFPLAYGFYLSLTNYTGFNLQNIRMIGLNNYRRVFLDGDAMYSLFRTFYIAIITIPLGMLVSFILALLLIQNIKGQGIFRTIYYLPSIIPVISAGLMWKIMFSRDRGIINAVLKVFSIEKIFWLDYNNVTKALIIMMLWGAAGGILINIAGLKNIPKVLYESAEIDGASSLQKLLKITIPLFTPILFYNLLMGIIGSLQLFIQPVILSSSSEGILSVPYRPNYTYIVHIYQQVFGGQRFGYGLALSWVVAVIILLLTIFVMKTSKLWVYYEVDREGKKSEKKNKAKYL